MEIKAIYHKEAKKLGIAEHKVEKWWKSLTPKEKEGMRRLGAVGLGGAGVALAVAYDPEAIGTAMLPTNLYIHRLRIKKALGKLRRVV